MLGGMLGVTVDATVGGMLGMALGAVLGIVDLSTTLGTAFGKALDSSFGSIIGAAPQGCGIVFCSGSGAKSQRLVVSGSSGVYGSAKLSSLVRPGSDSGGGLAAAASSRLSKQRIHLEYH